MLSRTFFLKLCHIISTAMESEEEKLFGGLNVILGGDFHQFPPVVARQSAPLYWPVDSRHDSEDDILGRKIFEQFTTVVQLKEQIRIRDATWLDVSNCPPTDFSSFPWKEARLVTPRHAVRNQWNAAAVRKHCAENHRRLYICPSEDTIGGRPVTNDEKIAIMTRTKGSKSIWTSRMV